MIQLSAALDPQRRSYVGKPTGAVAARVGTAPKITLPPGPNATLKLVRLDSCYRIPSGFQAVSPDGHLIVTGGCPVGLWSVETGCELGPISVADMASVSCARFGPDGRTLLPVCSIAPDGWFRPWVLDSATPEGGE